MKAKKRTRIIGIDYGLARIGLAISDENKIIATPYKTITTEKKSDKTIEKLLTEIEQLKKEYESEIIEIVVGLPLLMSGKAGLIADEVTHFVERLRTHTSTPVITWDERLTSVQAERSLRESSMTRKKRSKVVDTVSATIILQNYLDSKGSGQHFT